MGPWRRRPREDYGARSFILEALPGASIGAEIGVDRGEFASRLLRHLRPARLHLVDPWEYRTEAVYGDSLYGGRLGVDQSHMDGLHEKVCRRFRKEIARDQVLIHRARSQDAAATFPAQYFDWIYIDGDHRYEAVRADLERYHDRIKANGWIAGSGYRSKAWWGDGVVRAVGEFVASGHARHYARRHDVFLIQL